jgi:hypothetical protein
MKKSAVPPVPSEPLLKEVPMFTTDEIEIKTNMILYRPFWETGYDFRKEAKGSIEALRVFYVNNAARQFRTKCAKGCEEIFKLADGCSRERLFAKLAQAQDFIDKKAEKDYEKCVNKIDAVEGTMGVIEKERARIWKFKPTDIKEPKPVKM